ncbi:MAG: hypothetical protein Q9201_005530 [Fulgogasparrea decipioides]
MAAGHAIPTSVHDADHLHSHARQHITQRLPLNDISGGGTNGAPSTQAEDHNHSKSAQPQSHSHPQPFQDSDHQYKEDNEHLEHLDSASQLPPPRFTSIKSSNSRPKTMQRRISVGLPTHLRLQGKGYGVPAARKPSFVPSGDPAPRKWITFSELLSSILIALPYVFISVIYHHMSLRLRNATTLGLGQPLKITVENTPVTPAIAWLEGPALFITFAVTAATLILAGLLGKLAGVPGTSERKVSPGSGKSASWSSPTIFSKARKITERLSCVALPLYAALSLGGSRVALVLLVAIFAKIMTLEDGVTTLADAKGWKQLVHYRRWTLVSVLAQGLFDFLGRMNSFGYATLATGYLALVISIVFLPPPLPSVIRDVPSHEDTNKPASASVVLSSGFETPSAPEVSSLKKSTVSPLLCTPDEVSITLQAGVISAVFCCLAYLRSNLSAGAFSLTTFGWFFLTTFTTTSCILVAQPQSLQENKGIGFLIGSITSSLASYLLRDGIWRLLACQSILICLSFVATQIDTKTVVAISSKSSHRYNPSHHRAMSHTTHSEDHSKFTRYLLETFQHRPLLHSILVEKDSRRIFYFMCLNFAFMLVQLFYGIATGSLGLLSDSIHMFFDCLALIVGLCAAVMSKWPPSTRFPYGYGKVDTLAGFANGIFLILISLEIVYEALERLTEGSEMHRIGELLTVSTLGLAVNVVGVTAFGHAHHGHSHEGHDHGHSHGSHGHDRGHVDQNNVRKSHDGHDHPHTSDKHTVRHDHSHQHEQDSHLQPSPNPSPFSSVPTTPSKPIHAHSHTCDATTHHHHHHHSHGNDNMYGIYLHIMADTLGSVAVVVSTLLIHFYGWSGFDPLASCFIAILIFASAIPLVKSSATTLLLTIPEDTEFDLREALSGISALRGAVGYAAPKFWLEEGNERKVLGVIHVTAARGADMEDLKERAVAYLKSKNMDVVVQVEREGTNRCWCKAKAG